MSGKKSGKSLGILKLMISSNPAEFVLLLGVLEKNCFAHGLRQLTRDVESDIRTLNF